MRFILLLAVLISTVLPSYAIADPALISKANINKSDANIIGHVIDNNSNEHVSYINIVIKRPTIGKLNDATGHYFLKNLQERNSSLEIS